MAIGLISVSSRDGQAFHLLWPNHPWINQFSLVMPGLVSMALRIALVTYFLNIASINRNFYTLSRYLILAVIITMLITVAIDNIAIISVLTISAFLLSSIYTFTLCLFAFKKRIKLALPLLITLAIAPVGGIIYALDLTGLTNPSSLSLHAPLIAQCVQMLFLAVLQAYQMKRLSCRSEQSRRQTRELYRQSKWLNQNQPKPV